MRHGESEGNVADEASKHGDHSYFTEEFRSRHSSSWNLTPKGEMQAKAAGEWIKKNIKGGLFDGYYVSSYRRARRTAGLLDLPGAEWRIRDYIREHDWGSLDVMTNEERKNLYPNEMKKREVNPYYFSAPGGESLADVVVRARVGIISTLYREYANKTAIVVSHGNLMWPIRIIMEDILPEDYLAIKKKKDPRDEIDNCQIFQYTRVDPKTGEITEKFNWMRSVCPWDVDEDRDTWREIKHRRYTNEELRNF